MQLKSKIPFIVALSGILCTACNEVYKRPPHLKFAQTSILKSVDLFNQNLVKPAASYPVTNQVFTGSISPTQILAFARTLMGTPYVWGSSNPDSGLDCSGFVNYVFRHYNIEVPRTTIYFSHINHEVPLATAQPGDLILFTGTDSSTAHTIGHMGIIENVAKGQVSFIHSSSGPAHGVTITPLNSYYKGRFVKLVRVFPDAQTQVRR